MHKSSRFIFWGLTVCVFSILVGLPLAQMYPSKVSLTEMLTGPSAVHLLGTDNLGRDVLVRLQGAVLGAVLPTWCVIVGAHILGILTACLQIASGASIIRRILFSPLQILSVLVLSVPLGIVVFYTSAIFEKASFSAFLMAVGVVMFFSTYVFLHNLYNEHEKLGYWMASKSLGASSAFRLLEHGMLRNWKPSLFRLVCFQLKIGVAAEAAVSYLGYATQEPAPSFGNIIASHFDLLLKGNFFVPLVTAAAMLFTSIVPESFIGLWAFFNEEVRPKTFLRRSTHQRTALEETSGSVKVAPK
jgi:peptide/nickel transport system permease protein